MHGKSRPNLACGFLILQAWINQAPAVTTGDAASAGRQVTLCDPIWHAGFRSSAGLLVQTAICFLYLCGCSTGFLISSDLVGVLANMDFSNRQFPYALTIHTCIYL